LERDGVVDGTTTEFVPLSGGVSCDVVRVTTRGRTMVVKRACERLRVGSDWFADPVRNRHEHRYLEVVGGMFPGAVPGVLEVHDDSGYFCMEWLGDGWRNWKHDLLDGWVDAGMAAKAGELAGKIHRETSGRPDLLALFDTTSAFFALRLDPYFLEVARRHPDVRPVIMTEVDRVAATRECLVHGDFSPKNILVREDRLVVLDCEVAWYGDPRFDVTFLLCHFLLKALWHAPQRVREFATLVDAALGGYGAARQWSSAGRDAFFQEAAKTLLILLLARVDGKSPVEYLADSTAKMDFVRSFCLNHLASETPDLRMLVAEWMRSLESLKP
jgi:aminoglycoside phosphotransferase (APT) family kinase protein